MLFLFVLYSMELAKKKFAVMSYEIIQFFKTSRKESIYHTFMHETIIHSFTIYVCHQDIVLLIRLLSESYEIAHSIR